MLRGACVEYGQRGAMLDEHLNEAGVEFDGTAQVAQQRLQCLMLGGAVFAMFRIPKQQQVAAILVIHDDDAGQDIHFARMLCRFLQGMRDQSRSAALSSKATVAPTLSLFKCCKHGARALAVCEQAANLIGRNAMGDRQSGYPARAWVQW